MRKTMKMGVGATLFALCALWLAAPYAAEYYVDAQNGDDNAPGTAPDAAWRSLERVNRAELLPGDRVLFRRGGLWRGRLSARNGEEGNPVYYGDYGEGVKPTFLNSVDLTNPDDWVAPSEPDSKIWKTRPSRTLADEPIPGVERSEFRLWTEGESKARIESVESGESETGRLWRLAVEKSGKVATHLQVIASNVPIQRGYSYVTTFRFRSSVPFSLKNISLNKNGSPWSNYAHGRPESVEVGTEWTRAEFRFTPTADDPAARLAFYLGGVIPDGAVLEFVPLETRRLTLDSLGLSIDVGNIILTPKGGLPTDRATFFEDDTRRKAAFKRWKPEDLKAQDDYWYDADSDAVWYYSEGNPAERFDEMEAALNSHLIRVSHYVTLENLAAGYGAAHGVAGYHSKGCVIRGCDFFWLGGGDHSAGYKSPTRFGNGVEFWSVGEDQLVENCRFWQIYDVAMSIQGSAKTVYRNIVWRNNLVWKCEQSFELWLTDPESEIRENVFEKNRCYDAGYGWGHEQRPNKNGTHLLAYNLRAKVIEFKIQDNVFCRGRDGLIMFWNDRIGEFDLDRNVWWQPETEDVAGADQPLFRWGLSGAKTEVPFEKYRELTGNDAHSRFENPESK